MSETVLIVDDEESVRRTFQEWLRGLPVTVLTAADAEAALTAANAQPIDLAILDWNLGTGNDGLQLLEDLVEFQPDIVAILVTGYAAQATPLNALRKGVRDYLDKNHELNRETFLAAVQRQLNLIVPAKRQRTLNASLAQFRQSVEKVLPLIRAAATLNDPVPLTTGVQSLLRFAMKTTGSTAAALVVHSDTGTRAYGPDGESLDAGAVPFHRTLASSALSMQDVCVLTDLKAAGAELYLFEAGRKTLLAVPIPVEGVSVVLELFDKPTCSDADRRTAALVGEIGSELLNAALAERRTHGLLADAVEAALAASDDVRGTVPESAAPPPAVMESLRQNLEASVVDADLGLDLIAAIRELAVRHGPDAVQHCVSLVRSLTQLLDKS